MQTQEQIDAVAEATQAEYLRNHPDAAKDTNPKDMLGSAKVPVGLVPDTALVEMAMAFFEGASKYGRYNWRIAGVRASIYNDAMERHRKKWWNGQDRDPVTRVRELASVMACCAILIDSEICGKLNDDRPPLAPLGDLLDANMELVAHLKELFKDHNPKQYTWEDSLPPGPLEPEGFPDGYSSEQRPVQANHVSIDGAATDHPDRPAAGLLGPCAVEGCYAERELYSINCLAHRYPVAEPTAAGPLKLDCGCVKRCKGHPVSLDAAKVDVPASPGNYAAERAAEAKGTEVPLNSMWQHGATPTGPKDPQGRPYASTTADAEFPHPPPCIARWKPPASLTPPIDPMDSHGA